MVAKCMEEAHAAGGSAAESGVAGIADSILLAVYRYLCGYGNGLLSDPLLHRVIYGLMTKLFQKLVGALRKLGTRVVYADFARIIISTDKHVSMRASLFVLFAGRDTVTKCFKIAPFHLNLLNYAFNYHHFAEFSVYRTTLPRRNTWTSSSPRWATSPPLPTCR